MADSRLTREFSICLVPPKSVAQDIEVIRRGLPESPYRDDVPHMTLLRGITVPADVSDDVLVENIERVLSLSDALPLTAQFKAIANSGNRFYSSSGLILLEPSPELGEFRRRAIDELTRNGFKIETQETARFVAHMTVRLGVPLEGSHSHRAKEAFDGRTIVFDQWLLFRLMLDEGGKRTMHLCRFIRPL